LRQVLHLRYALEFLQNKLVIMRYCPIYIGIMWCRGPFLAYPIRWKEQNKFKVVAFKQNVA
jgi:hypothetical protein